MIQTITFYKSPDDILASYDKSGIDCKNTWDDWHILAEERPVFAPPETKTNYIEVPGGNGSLDLTESLTRYPTYNNREGSFKFRVMNDYVEDDKIVNESYDNNRWTQRYSEIMEFLHGQYLYAVLADDPTWFYQGRFTVDSWESGETWSEITIGYNVNPFKWSVSSSTSEWLWDPFNFETGVIWSTICKDIYVYNTTKIIYLPSSLYDSTSDIDEEVNLFSSTSDTDENKHSMSEFFGKVPISPTITFVPECPTHNKTLVADDDGILTCPVSGCGEVDKGIEIRFKNTYLDIDITETFKGGTTFMPDFLFYGQTEPYEITLKGCGTVSIDFRIGRL